MKLIFTIFNFVTNFSNFLICFVNYQSDFKLCHFCHFENQVYHDLFDFFIISCFMMHDLCFRVNTVYTNSNDIFKFIIFRNTILNALSRFVYSSVIRNAHQNTKCVKIYNIIDNIFFVFFNVSHR